jgi:hypothetical protein
MHRHRRGRPEAPPSHHNDTALYDFRVDQLPVLAIICFVLIVSRSLWAIIAIMIALILGLIALVLRLEYPSPLTNWFETTAEILLRGKAQDD